MASEARSFGLFLGGALATLAVAACGTGATVSPGPPSTATASAAPSTGVAIPTAGLPAHIQCEIAHGMKLQTIVPSRLPGGAPGYGMTSDLPNDETMAIMEECSKLSPYRTVQTDADIRIVYDRWVKERECLVGLGYQPTEPPTFEKFLADWRGSGPWMPIDGIDPAAQQGADFDLARKDCTLEMLP